MLPIALQAPFTGGKNSAPLPLRLGGSVLGLNPKGDVTTGNGPATATYFGGITKGQQYIAAHSNNINTQNATMDVFNKYFARTRNNQGQSIQLSPGQTEANWKDLATTPTALQAVQATEQAQGKGNYDPEWDLSPQQLQAYATYKSLAPGDPEKAVLSQNNPWITTTEQASQAWANKQTFSGNSVQAPGAIPYPNLTADQNNLMTQATQLSQIPSANRTPQQISQLKSIENDPRLQSAYTAIQDYTNAERQSMGLSPINYIPNMPPAVSEWSNAYEAASTAQRQVMKANNPDMYAQMNQAYENSDIGTLEKQASIAYLSGKPSDSLLSAIYNLGNYDVSKSKNANGTSSYALGNFTGGNVASSGLPTVASSSITNAASTRSAQSKAASIARRLKSAKPYKIKVSKKGYITSTKVHTKHLKMGAHISNIKPGGHYTSTTISKGNKIKNIKAPGVKQYQPAA
jgi:hypothetical protein